MPVPTSKNGSSFSSSFQNESGNHNNFFLRLRLAREKAGFSQKELSNKVGVSTNTIQSWEKDVYPKADKALELSKVLNCSISWLLKGEGAKDEDGINENQVVYIDHATELVHEVEKEVGISLNDRQRKAVVEILRKEIDRRNQESKDQIASLLTSFKEE